MHSQTRSRRGPSANAPETPLPRVTPPASLARALAVAVTLVIALILISQWLLRGVGGLGGAAGAVQPFTKGEQILRDLSHRYQAMNSYEDRMVMRMQIPVGEQWRDESADVLVRFVRPNKLRLHVSRPATQVLLTSDGERLQTRIFDDIHNDFDQQFLQHQAPERMALSSIFTATEMVSVDHPGQLQSILMSLPCPLPVSQLALLFDERLVEQLIETSKSIDRLPDRTLGDLSCARVRLWSPAGQFVFWIDVNEGLLRRIEYPAAPGSARATDADSTATAAAQLTADFDSIVLNRAFPPTSFRQQPPKEAALVRHFVLPPVDDAAKVLGRRVTQFWFTDLSGERVTASHLGAPINLIVWFNNRSPSRTVLDVLNALYAQSDRNSVQMIGVCTEPTTSMSHDEVRRLAREWNISFPVVRDLEAFGRDAFGVMQAPTMVILDANHVVQVFEVGGGAQLQDELPVVFDKLLEGEPLASNYLAFLADRSERYRLLLAGASIDAPTSSPDQFVPRESPAAPRSVDPTDSSAGQSVSAAREWVKQLGIEQLHELQVVNTDRETYLLVSDADGSLHDVALNGQRRESFRVVSPRVAIALRGSWDRHARPLLALLAADGVLRVFDSRGALQFEYPGGSAARRRVTDALVADLDGDDQSDVYVLVEGREVHRVDSTGRLMWSSPEFQDATSLCVSHDLTGRRYLLVAHGSNRVTPVSSAGQLYESLALGFSVERLLASPRASDDGAFCALSQGSNGTLRVVGCDAGLTEIWSHPLPHRPTDHLTAPIAWVPWEYQQRVGFWLIWESPQELTAISEDGAIVRRIAVRGPVRGFAGVRDANKNFLFTTVQDALVAWTVSFD